ncbi:MAG: UMP kinase [Mycoplasmatales bacterium]
MSKRVLIKLSGEALAGTQGFGIDPEFVKSMAFGIKGVIERGIQVSIVVGGGNIWRGQTAAGLGMERSQADYMGMLATIMNGLALQDALESIGVHSRVQTSLHADQVAEPYVRRRAIRHMEKGRVVILAGGTGMPYFSTDSNTMLRAAELAVDFVMVAKNGVDGVYDRDPNKYPEAKMYENVTYSELLEKKIHVMDLTAFTLAEENNLRTVVFNMNDPLNLVKVLDGEIVSTTITK